MNITPRKLQRLGASSLVVTLPHTWIEAHGLKAGDVVYIVDEGDRLRIVPSSKSDSRGSYVFEAYRLVMPQLVSMALTCLYVNNINEVSLDLKGMGDAALQALKSASMRLLGLELLELEKDKALMRVVLDDSKADPKHAIKGLGTSVSTIADLLRQAAEGQPPSDEQVEIATNDLIKYQHLIMRYVVGSMTSGSAEGSLQGTIVGTALMGVIGNVLLDAVRLTKSWGLRSKTVAEVASQIRDLSPLVGAMVAQPSVKRLHEVAMSALATSGAVEGYMSTTKDPREAAVLAKVDDAIKTMMITFMTILCGAVLSEDYLKPASG